MSARRPTSRVPPTPSWCWVGRPRRSAISPGSSWLPTVWRPPSCCPTRTAHGTRCSTRSAHGSSRVCGGVFAPSPARRWGGSPVTPARGRKRLAERHRRHLDTACIPGALHHRQVFRRRVDHDQDTRASERRRLGVVVRLPQCRLCEVVAAGSVLIVGVDQHLTARTRGHLAAGQRQPENHHHRAQAEVQPGVGAVQGSTLICELWSISSPYTQKPRNTAPPVSR